jgi:mRNA interferase MazF
VPLTSKTAVLLAGEFVVSDWNKSGLNVASAVKRGLYTVHQSLIVKSIGKLSDTDANALETSLRLWLGLP